MVVGLPQFLFSASLTYQGLPASLRRSLPAFVEATFAGTPLGRKTQSYFQFAEFFAGHAAISLPLDDLGYSVAVCDKAYEGMDHVMDVTTRSGFLLAICIILLLERRGVA